MLPGPRIVFAMDTNYILEFRFMLGGKVMKTPFERHQIVCLLCISAMWLTVVRTFDDTTNAFRACVAHDIRNKHVALLGAFYKFP